MEAFIQRVTPLKSFLTLLCRLDKYPTVAFVVVIHPTLDSGNGTVPVDPAYQNALPNLTSRSNVVTVGHVDTNFALRNINDVLMDVNLYGSLKGNLEIQGIFFDHTPTAFTNNSLNYLNQIDSAVKDHSGFRGKKLVPLTWENMLT